MKPKNVLVLLFSLFLVPVSLFSECSIVSDSNAYFNISTFSSFEVQRGGVCVVFSREDVSQDRIVGLCDSISYQGDLPEGLAWYDSVERYGDFSISGTPAIGTEGEYSIELTVDLDLENTTVCQGTQTLIVYVLSKGVSHPPTDVKGTQSSPNPIIPLSTSRAKNKLGFNGYDNIISWKIPRSGPTIAAFRIYRDKDLTKLIKQVPIHKRRLYEHVIPNKSPNKNYIYYLVSVSDEGVISPSVPVKIKGYNKNKSNKTKEHHGCNCE